MKRMRPPRGLGSRSRTLGRFTKGHSSDPGLNLAFRQTRKARRGQYGAGPKRRSRHGPMMGGNFRFDRLAKQLPGAPAQDLLSGSWGDDLGWRNATAVSSFMTPREHGTPVRRLHGQNSVRCAPASNARALIAGSPRRQFENWTIPDHARRDPCGPTAAAPPGAGGTVRREHR